MTAPGDFTAGDVLQASDMNALPAGFVSYTNVPDGSATTSESDLCSDTFTTVSGRRYAVFVGLRTFNPSTTLFVTARIYKDATEICRTITGVTTTNAGRAVLNPYASFVGDGTSQTIKVTIQTSTGTCETRDAGEMLIIDVGEN